MFNWRYSKRPVMLGCIVGLVFGGINIFFTWLYPLDDDSPGALLRFYGPMFFVWALASFRASRRSGHFSSGIITGLIVAFTTFCVFDVLVLLRVNLFLYELTARADWQNLMTRFHESGADSLRAFINFTYLKGAPFKIGVASLVGAVMGVVGGTLGVGVFRYVGANHSGSRV